MANRDNHCSDLDVRDYYTENGYAKGRSSLADLYQLQAKTQQMYFEKQGKPGFDQFSTGDVVDFLMWTEHAIVDELHEMMDAVGGMHDGVGNAAWKPWKAANPEAREKSLWTPARSPGTDAGPGNAPGCSDSGKAGRRRSSA